MNKEELIKELKKSRRQTKDERYEYINSHFNQTSYAMRLEKYARELYKENKELHNKIEKAIEFINNNGEKQYNHHDNYRGKWYSPDELDTILEILKDSDVDE